MMMMMMMMMMMRRRRRRQGGSWRRGYLHAAVFLSQQAQLGLALAGATRLGGLNSPAQGGSCSAAHGGDPRSSLS
jgi:hypothetical protein